MKKNYYIFILLIISTLTLFSCANDEEIKISYYFESAINVNKGINDYKEVNFLPHKNLDLGFHKGNIWIKLNITNSVKHSSYVVMMNDLINRNYRFYKLDTISNEMSAVTFVKDLTRTDHRTFNHPNPNFKIDLAPNEKATYIITSNNDGRAINARPQLISIKNYYSFINKNTIWSVIFLGVIVFLLFINIYLWSIHKQKIYFYYIFYMLSTFFMYIGLEGYFYNFNIKHLHIDHIIFLSIRFWVIALIIYTSVFLEIQIVAPKYYNIIKWLLIIIIGGTTLYQFTFFYSSITHLHYFENILSFLWLLVILITVIISAKSRKLELKYYIIPLLCFLIFTAVGLIDGHFQILPGTPFVYIKIGTIAEFIGFTYFMTILIKSKLEKAKNIESELIQNKKELLAVSKELESKIDHSKTSINKTDLLNIFKLLESTLSKEEDWLEFKSKFEELSPYFLSNLKENHPTLTKSETRLLTLIEIGFTQKEIANILNIAPDSVKKAKHRVRKKLNLSRSIILTEYLSQYN